MTTLHGPHQGHSTLMVHWKTDHAVDGISRAVCFTQSVSHCKITCFLLTQICCQIYDQFYTLITQQIYYNQVMVHSPFFTSLQYQTIPYMSIQYFSVADAGHITYQWSHCHKVIYSSRQPLPLISRSCRIQRSFKKFKENLKDKFRGWHCGTAGKAAA